MPHTVGVSAKVTRLDAVFLRPNLFGGYDTCIFTDSSNNPTKVFPDVRIAVSDPGLRVTLGVDGEGSCYPDIGDTVLVCEKIGKFLCWYEVTYAYNNSTDQ